MIEWLDRHLVPGWRESWRWWSNQALIAGGAFAAMVAHSPDLLINLSALLGGGDHLQALVVVAVISILVLRMWNQSEADGE
jgi:hypothetical protein